MSLSDYTVPTAVVALSGGQVEVRGLSLEDLAILLRNHMGDLDKLILTFAHEVRSDVAISALVQHAVPVIREAPGLVSNLIALAADAPDEVDKVRRMSLAAKQKIIEKIAELTFEEAGGAKKFFASLSVMMTGLSRPEGRPSIDSPTSQPGRNSTTVSERT